MQARGRRAVTLLLVLLLVPGIVLTLVRLLEPWDGLWVRLESFTPFGIAAYGAALVVVLIRFAVRAALGHRPSRPRRSLPASPSTSRGSRR